MKTTLIFPGPVLVALFSAGVYAQNIALRDDDSGGDVVVASVGTISPRVLTAHGIIMATTFAVLYPMGSLLMAVVRKWWVHGVFQTVVWLMMWTGFGLGVTYAKSLHALFAQPHTLLGTSVVCLMAIQPALGYAHHRHFVKHGRRGIISYVHIWYGRALMILGVVNGGLGLKLVPASRQLKIAYGVVAGIMYLVYAVGKGYMSFRARKGAAFRGPKTEAGGSA